MSTISMFRNGSNSLAVFRLGEDCPEGRRRLCQAIAKWRASVNARYVLESNRGFASQSKRVSSHVVPTPYHQYFYRAVLGPKSLRRDYETQIFRACADGCVRSCIADVQPSLGLDLGVAATGNAGDSSNAGQSGRWSGVPGDSSDAGQSGRWSGIPGDSSNAGQSGRWSGVPGDSSNAGQSGRWSGIPGDSSNAGQSG